MRILFFILFTLQTFLFAEDLKIISTIDVKKDVENILKHEKIVKIAMSLLGEKYFLGGENSDIGFDCSGFTQYVYSRVNIKIPRTVNEQFNYAIKVRTNIKKGDLIFFSIKLTGIPDHVGIYIGNNEFIHSPSAGKYVRIDSINKRYWEIRFLTFGKFIY